jgi:hypothetical protein
MRSRCFVAAIIVAACSSTLPSAGPSLQDAGVSSQGDGAQTDAAGGLGDARTQGDGGVTTTLDYAAVLASYEANRQQDTFFLRPSELSGTPGLHYDAANHQWVIEGDGDLDLGYQLFLSDKIDTDVLVIRNHNQGTIRIHHSMFRGVRQGASNGEATPTAGQGIRLINASNVTIEDSYFEGLSFSAIYVDNTGSDIPRNNIKILRNRVLNLLGAHWSVASWKWTAYFAAVLGSVGTGNEITNNRILNMPGKSYLCDLINLFRSGGTSEATPFTVRENQLLGGGAQGFNNLWGGAIQMGDHQPGDLVAGNYIHSLDNVLVYPGLLGININGGSHNKITSNLLYFDGQVQGYDPVSTTSHLQDPWRMVLLYNYQKDGNFSFATVENNQTYCPTCANGTSFENKSNPTNSTIQFNSWTETSLTPANMLNVDFMNYACPARQAYWEQAGKFCSARLGAAYHTWSGSVTGNQTGASVTATCTDQRWTLTNAVCP